MSERHVVFGGGGGAGQAVIRALASRGSTVRSVTRSGAGPPAPGVEVVQADAGVARSAREACEGARVVYHCVNVPYAEWPDTLPGVMENLIEAAGAAGATLVYCDNLYMYGPVEGEFDERTPNAATSTKGKLRARLADQLLRAHGGGRVRATIGRASDFFGPGAHNTIAGQLVFPAVLAGKRAHWIGSLDVPHTLNYTEDVARALVRLGEEKRAGGEVWHLPAAPPLTGRQFIELAFGVAGRPANVGVYPRWKVRLAGIFDEQRREILELFDQFEQPFVPDTTKFAKAFPEFRVTPIAEAIENTLADAEARIGA